MPDNPTTGPVTASTAPTVRRRSRKCRTCGHRCTTALIHGQCATCAGLLTLPLRGEGGRFISITSEPTTADVYVAKYAAKAASPSTGATGGGR